jgi:hypothetical protein
MNVLTGRCSVSTSQSTDAKEVAGRWGEARETSMADEVSSPRKNVGPGGRREVQSDLSRKSSSRSPLGLVATFPRVEALEFRSPRTRHGEEGRRESSLPKAVGGEEGWT